MSKPAASGRTSDFTDQGCADLRWRSVDRRHVLRAGGLAALGLGLSQLWTARAASMDRASGVDSLGFGRAKACIFLFMWGGPSQLDTLDPKPGAPAEIRGPFSPIATRVPGIQLSEHFAQLAGVTDKLALVRSLHHDDPAHLSSGHLALTGHLAPTLKSDAAGPSERDTPHLGSILSRVRQSSGALPPFVTMPWLAYHPAAPGGRAPGQNAGWLGRKYDPLVALGDPSAADWKIPELTLPESIDYSRVQSRRELLAGIDAQRASLDVAGVCGFKERAFGLLGSDQARAAFDLSQEPDAVRERYGRNIHGQCVLMARRLVEHGVPLVSVNWHNDGRNFWDTHSNNFSRLKNDLIPPADRALATLIADLDERGMLDETIVAWVGEFGRRPRIDAGNAGDGGRAHWPFCYSGLLAGGGIRRGMVYGRSDPHAAYPAENPATPQDFAATILHALGVAPQATLDDRFGRPIRICDGAPILPLFG